MTYTDEQLLNRVIAIGGKINPNKHLIIGVQNAEDNFNKFDDKFYHFYNGEFVRLSTGTTNAGRTALKNFDKYGLDGAAVWKTDMFYEDLYGYGLHKGKMPCLRQKLPIYFYRDTNKNDKAEEIGELHHDIIYANFHFCDYDLETDVIKTDINGWSFACQVLNQAGPYNAIIADVRAHPDRADYALLKQF